MAHPLFRQPHVLYAYALIWLVMAMGQGVLLAFNQHSLGLHGVGAWLFLDSLVYNALFAAMGIGLWYPTRYFTLERRHVPKVAISHLAVAAVVSGLWLSAGQAFLTEIDSLPQAYAAFLRASLPWRFLLGTLFYCVLVAFYYVFIYADQLKERQVREAELQTLVKEAELRSLKFQINPHFIFNALNSINSLTLTNPRRASEMTIKLADYLRYTLSHNETQLTRLKDELQSVALYLDIEKVRFGDKIDYVQEVSRGCLEAQVPSMLLQPLFENAIKYGVYESLEPVRIHLRCRREGGYLQATLENTCEPDAVARKGEGIGLRNIQERLERLYRRRYLLRVEREPSLFRVILRIPQASGEGA